MKKDFLFNIILLLCVNLLIKPFYIFGIDRTVQNVVGEEQYGLFFTFFNLAYLMQIINDFGIQNYNSRTIAQDTSLIPSYLPSLIFLKSGLAILFAIALFGIAYLLGYRMPDLSLLGIICLSLIFSAFFLFFRANIAALGRYTTDSLLSVLDKVLMIVVVGFLLWFYKDKSNFSIYWFAYAQAIVFAVSAFIAFLILKGRIPKLVFIKDKEFYVDLFKKSLPFALVLVLMTIYTRIDAVMIERMLPDGERQAGIYAAGYRILDATNMLGFLVAGLLLPMFSKLLKASKSVESLCILSFRFIFTIIFTFAVISFFYQQPLMELLYDEAINAPVYYGKVFGMLMLGGIAINTSYVFGTLLTANAN
ncbi:MAG: oligosaccharide flippase family protein, partial [Bacteroidota bacterium]